MPVYTTRSKFRKRRNRWKDLKTPSHLSAMRTSTVKIYQQSERPHVAAATFASQLERQAGCVCASASLVVLEEEQSTSPCLLQSRGAPLVFSASQDLINRPSASRKRCCREESVHLSPHNRPPLQEPRAASCRLPSVLFKSKLNPTPGRRTLLSITMIN